MGVLRPYRGCVQRVAGQGAQGAQLVNTAGTWTWSNLNTRDPEGAEAFYGAVFGWEAVKVDIGDYGESTMWCVQGYAEVLEAAEPGLRERQSSQGAPPEIRGRNCMGTADDERRAR